MDDTKYMIIGILIGLTACIIIHLIIISYMNFRIRKAKRKIEKSKLSYPECKRGCDVNQCNTWCMAKERFKNNPPDDF